MTAAAAWPDKRFAALLGSRLPIIAAPMAGATSVALAVAAIEGGAVGSLPCGLIDPDTALAQAQEVRAQAGGPLNLNFFCHEMSGAGDDSAWRALLQPFYEEYGIAAPVPGGTLRLPFGDAMCAVVEQVRPELVSFHFGLPGAELLERVRRTGARILCTATSVDEGRWLARRGVDAIVAQGWEAGGHNGRFLGGQHDSQMGLIALLPQLADATGLPVIAAGGIADGRGIAAALTLGACAVQIGTAFLHCPESQIRPQHRAGLASAEAERTIFTNLFTGRLARGLPTRLTETLGSVRSEAPPFPHAGTALQPIAQAAAERAEPGFSPMWAGQAARLGRPEPARALTERLGREALALLATRA